MFDRVYSAVRGFSRLPPSCKYNLVETLRSNFSVLLPNVDSLSRASLDGEDDSLVLNRICSHRNALKIYTFYLFSIILTEESNACLNNTSKVLSSFFSVAYIAT